MKRRAVYHVSEVKPFSPPSANGEYVSRLLVDQTSVGSDFLFMNEFTLEAGCQTYQGNHGLGYDEAYFILEGEGVLFLEDLETGDYESYPVSAGSYAFIRGGRGHYIENVGENALRMLTIMPKNPSRGVNGVYDARLAAWGTSFELIDNLGGQK